MNFFKSLIKNESILKYGGLVLASLGIPYLLYVFLPIFTFSPGTSTYKCTESLSFIFYAFGHTFIERKVCYSAPYCSYETVTFTPSLAGLIIFFTSVIVIISSITALIHLYKPNSIIGPISFTVLLPSYLLQFIFLLITLFAFINKEVYEANLSVLFFIVFIISILETIVLSFFVPLNFAKYFYDKRRAPIIAKELNERVNNKKNLLYPNAKAHQEVNKMDEQTKLNKLKELKESYDDGAITKEEYEEKKKLLLEDDE